MLFKYSDGLIRWFDPSDVPLGKLGGTNGKTSCLFTKFGPLERDWAACPCAVATVTDDDAQYCAWYVWYSSDDEALPPPLLFWCCTDDVVPLISRAFLFAVEMDVNIKNPPTKYTTVYHLKQNERKKNRRKRKKKKHTKKSVEWIVNKKNPDECQQINEN